MQRLFNVQILSFILKIDIAYNKNLYIKEYCLYPLNYENNWQIMV